MELRVEGHFANKDTFLMPHQMSLFAKLTAYNNKDNNQMMLLTWPAPAPPSPWPCLSANRDRTLVLLLLLASGDGAMAMLDEVRCDDESPVLAKVM